jgi:hypothetical protein
MVGTRSSSVKTDTRELGKSNEKPNVSEPTNNSYGVIDHDGDFKRARMLRILSPVPAYQARPAALASASVNFIKSMIALSKHSCGPVSLSVCHEPPKYPRLVG